MEHILACADHKTQYIESSASKMRLAQASQSEMSTQQKSFSIAAIDAQFLEWLKEAAPEAFEKGRISYGKARSPAKSDIAPPVGRTIDSDIYDNREKSPTVAQLSLPSLCPVTTALEALATADTEARGAIFTRRPVVDFILNLAEYTMKRPLHRMRILEPAFGDGDFLLPAIDRLISAWQMSEDRSGDPVADLAASLCAVELHRNTYEATKRKVILLLIKRGLSARSASALADQWLLNGDFLLISLPTPFDFVVGNPPYLRQEMIPDALIAEYRARYLTVYDRADLYVPFIERSLTSLAEGGQLGFICADRWMKNRYGGPLRRFVAEQFHLKIYVDMVDTPAFRTDVIAYPAITVIARKTPGPTRIASRPKIDNADLSRLAAQLLADRIPDPANAVRVVEGVVAGSEPWIFESSERLALVRRLESMFPTLGEVGCKVGIGVATGADKAFIGPYDALDVEPDRKLPLAMTSDILSGQVLWRGLGVVNPFSDQGGLVQLADYPRLKRYLESRRDQIAKRHVAQKTPANWYRTIDRIYPTLARTPKLLIPDIKGDAHIVYENGRLYPHHNLYFITSEQWNLGALRAILMSGIARLFVEVYSTRMRGGYLRFQAQYLRRIRIPSWEHIPSDIRDNLIEAGGQGDLTACNRAVSALFDLTTDEQAILVGGST